MKIFHRPDFFFQIGQIFFFFSTARFLFRLGRFFFFHRPYFFFRSARFFFFFSDRQISFFFSDLPDFFSGFFIFIIDEDFSIISISYLFYLDFLAHEALLVLAVEAEGLHLGVPPLRAGPHPRVGDGEAIVVEQAVQRVTLHAIPLFLLQHIQFP